MSINPIKKVNKIYGYVRVSTDEQAAHGISLETQKKEISEFVKGKYHCEVDAFFEDDGYSGKIPVIVNGEANPERPGMADLLNNLEEYDVVITTRLDRLSRSTNDLLGLIPYFQEVYMTLFFCEQFGDVPVVYPKPTSEAGLKARFDMGDMANKIMLMVLSAVAEMEFENTKKKFAEGKISWAQRGYAIGGSAPFGFRFEEEKMKNGNRVKTRKKLVEVPKEQDVLKTIRNCVKRGLGARRIARQIQNTHPEFPDFHYRKVERILQRKHQGLHLSN